MDINIEDSISNRIKNEVGRRDVSTAVNDLVEYVTDIHNNGDIPVKFTVEKRAGVRYYEYNLEIKLCASDPSYLKKNIKDILDTDKLYRDRLLKILFIWLMILTE